jgi:hypothetical protein
VAEKLSYFGNDRREIAVRKDGVLLHERVRLENNVRSFFGTTQRSAKEKPKQCSKKRFPASCATLTV